MFEPTILISTVYKLLAGVGGIGLSTYAGRQLILLTAMEFDDKFSAFKDAEEDKINQAIKAGKKGKDLRKIKSKVKKAISAEKKRLIQLKISEKGIKAMLRKLRKAGDDNAADNLSKFAKKHGTKATKTAKEAEVVPDEETTSVDSEEGKKAAPAKTAETSDSKPAAKTAESKSKKKPAKKTTVKKRGPGRPKTSGATA